MKTSILGLVLAGLAASGGALAASDIRELPYAAGNPAGGVPLWNPGDKFVAVSSGACAGTCPVYDLYVFSDGHVVFVGRDYTGRKGVSTKQVGPDVYTSLLTLVVRTQVLEKKLKRGSCLSGRAKLMVMRSTPDGQRVRVRDLNPGCAGHADIAHDIESNFISSTDIEPWLVPRK